MNKCYEVRYTLSKEDVAKLEEAAKNAMKEFNNPRDGEKRNQPALVKERKRWKSPYVQTDRTRRI